MKNGSNNATTFLRFFNYLNKGKKYFYANAHILALLNKHVLNNEFTKREILTTIIYISKNINSSYINHIIHVRYN